MKLLTFSEQTKKSNKNYFFPLNKNARAIKINRAVFKQSVLVKATGEGAKPRAVTARLRGHRITNDIMEGLQREFLSRAGKSLLSRKHSAHQRLCWALFLRSYMRCKESFPGLTHNSNSSYSSTWF